MPLGKQKRNDAKAFYIKMLLKKDNIFLNKPAFKISQKDGDQYKDLPDLEYEIGGNLIETRIFERQTDKGLRKTIGLTLSDHQNGEIYFLNLTFNNVSRSLINSLLSLQSYNDIVISLYETKPNPNKNNKTYPAASLRQNDEIVRWKFEKNQLPKPSEHIINGNKQLDWAEHDNFLIKELNELNNKIKSSRLKDKPEGIDSNASVLADTPPVAHEDLDEDVPF